MSLPLEFKFQPLKQVSHVKGHKSDTILFFPASFPQSSTSRSVQEARPDGLSSNLKSRLKSSHKQSRSHAPGQKSFTLSFVVSSINVHRTWLSAAAHLQSLSLSPLSLNASSLVHLPVGRCVGRLVVGLGDRVGFRVGLGVKGYGRNACWKV